MNYFLISCISVVNGLFHQFYQHLGDTMEFSGDALQLDNQHARPSDLSAGRTAELSTMINNMMKHPLLEMKPLVANDLRAVLADAKTSLETPIAQEPQFAKLQQPESRSKNHRRFRTWRRRMFFRFHGTAQ